MSEHPPVLAGPAKLLVAVFDAGDEWEGVPLHEAIVHALESLGIAGATVLQGLTGFGTHRAVHRKGLVLPPHDKPVLLLVVDSDERLRAAVPTLRAMITQGVVLLVDADVIHQQ
jgi:PII-like signaling protein